jgi:hypothetical protein
VEEFSGLHGLRDEWYYLRDRRRVGIGACGDGAPHDTGAAAKTDIRYTKTDSLRPVVEPYLIDSQGGVKLAFFLVPLSHV